MEPSSSLKPTCAYTDCVSSDTVLLVLKPGLKRSSPSGAEASVQLPVAVIERPLTEHVRIALPAAGRRADRRLKSSNAPVRLNGVSSATMSGTVPLSPTPQSPMVRFEPEARWRESIARVSTPKRERAVLRHVELAVDARLLDVGSLVLVGDAQDLRAEARRPERIVGVAAGARVRRELRREQRARRHRQAVVEVERLRPEVRRVAARDGRGRVGGIRRDRTRGRCSAPCRRG